jgi:hypothetical protein
MRINKYLNIRLRLSYSNIQNMLVTFEYSHIQIFK